MKYSLLLLFSFLFFTESNAQELLSYKTCKGGLVNTHFLRHGDFYYDLGRFSESIEVGFDHESVTINKTNASKTQQVYIVKYDLDFNIVWARELEVSNHVSTTYRMYPYQEYLYIFWSADGSQDITYRCDRINVNETSGSQYVGLFKVGPKRTEFSVDFAPDGSIGIVGEYNDYVDFPTINGNNEHYVTGAKDMYIAKFSAVNTNESFFHRIRRGHGYPGLNNREAISIKFDDQGKLHVLGKYTDTAQLDGNDGPILKSLNGSSGFHVSFLPNGQLDVFEKNSFNYNGAMVDAIKHDDKYIYLAFPLFVTSDLNFQNFTLNNLPFGGDQFLTDYHVNDESITMLAQIGSFSSFEVFGNPIVKNEWDFVLTDIDFDGNLNWYSYFGADSGIDYGYSINYDDDENLVVALATRDTLDIDPSRNKVNVSYDIRTFQVAIYDIICQGLNVFLNDHRDINCTENGNLNLGIIGGEQPTQLFFEGNVISPNDDLEVLAPGVYEAGVVDAEGCSKSLYIPVSGPKNNGDLTLQAFCGEYRTGFDTKIHVFLSNEDCIPKSGHVELLLHHQIQYLDASITPSIVNGQAIIFDYEDLIFEDEKLQITLDVNISTEAQFGTDLCSSIYLYNQQGVKINSKVLCNEVINSYDPNDITVFPSGRCDQNYFLPTEELEYLIRFQNLGNAEAINIEVVDTLHTNLDISTIEVLESSHNHIVFVEQDSILVFKFPNINLLAEVQNEEQSHGFISFKIKAKNGTPIAAAIPNKAAIYFDFNEPVITNEVTSTLIDVLPSCITSKVDEIDSAWSVYPNPVKSSLFIRFDQQSPTSIKLYDLFGKEVISKQIQGDTELDLSHLPKGMYVLHTQNETIKIFKD